MIRVYFNLHKCLFSVQEKAKGRWKVIRHTDFLVLKDVKFKVSEKGRQRVLREKRKNVHAYIIGEEYKGDLSYGCQIFYNPYLNEGFVRHTGEIIKDSPFVMMYVLNKKPQVFAIERE